jgi:hypothetical protein
MKASVRLVTIFATLSMPHPRRFWVAGPALPMRHSKFFIADAALEVL